MSITFIAGLFINDGGMTINNGGLEVVADGVTVSDGGMVVQHSGISSATLEVRHWRSCTWKMGNKLMPLQ